MLILFIMLQIVHNAHEKSYEESLTFSDDISVHQKQHCMLAMKVHKPLMKTNPDFMRDFYTIKPVLMIYFPADTGRKLNVYKTFRSRLD